MLRLTKSKLRGIELPDLPTIGKGNTSIVFDNGDSVIVYTIEQLKCDWLRDGLEIIDEFHYVGWAEYAGFVRGWSGSRSFGSYKCGQLNVYRYEMPKIEFASNRSKAVRDLRKAADEIRYKYIWKGGNQGIWEELAKSDLNALRDPALFIKGFNYNTVYPDFGPGDWAYVNGELVCVDPFHDEYIAEYFRLGR